MSNKLHLGCGPDVRAGWLNVDSYESDRPHYLQHDLRNGLPKLNAPLEVVYSCHFFEHLTDAEGLVLMKKCHDAMRIGGRFRMALPNFESMVAAYVRRDWEFFGILDWGEFSDPSTRSLIDVCSYGVYQFGEHKSIWDEEKGVKILTKAGFRQARRVEYDYEFDPKWEVRERFTIVFEAFK